MSTCQTPRPPEQRGGGQPPRLRGGPVRNAFYFGYGILMLHLKISSQLLQ